MEKGGWVYNMANRYRGGLYVGVTSDLTRRVWQHREGDGSIYVTDFGKKRLVYERRWITLWKCCLYCRIQSLKGTRL